MRKYLKILFLCLLCVCLMLSVYACGGGEDTDDNDNLTGDDNEEETLEDDYMSEDEIKQLLKNYRFEYSFIYTEGEETTTTTYKDIRTEKAWYYIIEGENSFAYLADVEDNAFYMLDVDEKTAICTELGNNYANDWGSHFFNWHSYWSNFKKKGTEKVAGRDCTVYEYKMGSVTARYSIDNEYDLCLKYEATTAEVTSIFIFTKAEIGTVETEEVLAYLDDYEIDDYRNII